MRGLPRGFKELPNGRVQWRAKVRGRYLKGSADTLAQAQVDRARAQLDAGHDADEHDEMTVRELVDIHVEEAKVAESTAEIRDAALSRLPDAFYARSVRSVDPRVVDQLWRSLRNDGVGPHTIRKIHQALSVAWKRAVVWEMVTSNPFRVAPPPSPPTAKRVAPPSARNVSKLVAAMKSNSMLAAWVTVAAVAGPRPGELCALRWDAVDVDRSKIAIGPGINKHGSVTPGKLGEKGHRDVVLPLPAMRALAKLPRSGEWVFSREGDMPLRPQMVNRSLRYYSDKAGIDRVTPYSLRHFAASQAIAAGVPIPEVAAMLGDNPATVMKTYAHFVPRDSTAASAVADALGWS